MKNKSYKIAVSFAIALSLVPILFVMLFLLFGRDYEIDLPHGYKLVRVYEGAVGLVDSSRSIILDPNIDSYRIHEQFLLGHRSRVEDQDPYADYNNIYGYFILNMRRGKLQQGLSKRQWLQELRQYNITNPPKLRVPSRYDHYLRARELNGKQ